MNRFKLSSFGGTVDIRMTPHCAAELWKLMHASKTENWTMQALRNQIRSELVKMRRIELIRKEEGQLM